jgi:ribosomal protein S6
VDRLSKSAHFVPVNTKYQVEKYAEIYIGHVLCLHGVLKMITSDRGSQFVARFWEQLNASLGTHLIHSSAYHPQTDGQIERVNQILEDILRACVMEYQGSWDRNLPWAEFFYNNSYQESMKMAQFEVLYGRRCRTPLNWIEPREKVIFRPDIIEEAEMIVRRVQENLKATKSRQETYANKRRRPLAFEVGDHVYLRVSPMKGVKRFGVKGKLAPRYIGPFPILEKCGTIAYKPDLSPSLAGVYDIFHMSQLKKCLKVPMDIVLSEVTPLEADLSYPENPIKILDQKDQVTRHKTIKFFKIHWSNHSEEEATWESEDFLHSRHMDFELP